MNIQPLLHAVFAPNVVRHWAVLCEFVPDLAPNFGVPQSMDHHPEGPVHVHICQVIARAALPLIRSARSHVDRCDYTFVLAALFHDIGKAATHVYDRSSTVDELSSTEHDGKHSFHDHESKSVEILQAYDELLYAFGASKQRVEGIVRHHMRAHRYVDGEMKKQSSRREFESLPYFRDLLIFEAYDRSPTRDQLR